jgi:hypothetical protein
VYVVCIEHIVILCMSLLLFFVHGPIVLEDMLFVMHVCDSCNVIMCSIACMNYCQLHRSLEVSMLAVIMCYLF